MENQKSFKVLVISLDPRPTYEIETIDINKLIAWLFNPVPGDNIFVIFKNEKYHFQSFDERRQFATGFERAAKIFEFEIENLNDEIDMLKKTIEESGSESEPIADQPKRYRSGTQLKAVPDPNKKAV